MTYAQFILNKFSGQDVHIVGSGASMVGFDYSYFTNKICIAINHAFKLFSPQYLVFNDAHFITSENYGKINYEGIIFCPKRTQQTGLNYYNFDLVDYFSFDPGKGVYMWQSSALSAVTIALQGNANKIFLWGLDYRFFTKNEVIRIAKENSNDQHFIDHVKGCEKSIWTHSTDDRFKHSKNKAEDILIFKDVIKYFDVFPKNKIFNMSKYSAIPYFPTGIV